jgi:hypothetical protein
MPVVAAQATAPSARAPAGGSRRRWRARRGRQAMRHRPQRLSEKQVAMELGAVTVAKPGRGARERRRPVEVLKRHVGKGKGQAGRQRV